MKQVVFYLVTIVICVGFGILSGVELASAQSTPPASQPATALPQTPAATPPAEPEVERLLKMQESVLEQAARHSEHSKSMMDFAILTVGFVGSLVLVIFAYFGYNTAKDAKQVKNDADAIKEKLDDQLKKATEQRVEIEKAIVGKLQQQLAHFTDYGLKVAEFAAASPKEMTTEDLLRNCDEALDALDKSQVGERANRARSFVLGRKGLAFLREQRVTDALRAFEDAERINVARKPDRPYNIACCCSRLAASAPVAAEVESYKARAVKKLKECLDLAIPNGPVESTISKAYFLLLMRDGQKFDTDLNVLKGYPAFETLRA